MLRILIVYHSRSGYTRRVARSLARRLGADVDEIHETHLLGGAIGYAMCALEALAGATPAIRRSRHELADYDVIVVGTPVWVWRLASPVRSWLAQHPIGRARLALFCTMGGSGARRVLTTMTSLAGAKPIATLALKDAEIDAGSEAKLDAFVAAIEARANERTARRQRARDRRLAVGV